MSRFARPAPKSPAVPHAPVPMIPPMKNWALLRLAAAFALLTGCAVIAYAGDWPQFRGPDGQGHSSERGLPIEWSETKNIVWKQPIDGLGWS